MMTPHEVYSNNPFYGATCSSAGCSALSYWFFIVCG